MSTDNEELESFKADYIENRLSKIKRADQPNTYFFTYRSEKKFFPDLREAVHSREELERELSEEFNRIRRV